MEGTGATPEQAEPTYSGSASDTAQVATVVELLLIVGYVDGVFHYREQIYVRQYIDSVVLVIEQSAPADKRAMLRTRWETYFHDLYERLNLELAAVAAKLAAAETSAHVPSDLSERALALFAALTAQDKKTTLELVHALIHADAVVTPAEQNLYQNLTDRFVPEPPPAHAARTKGEPAPGHDLPSIMVDLGALGDTPTTAPGPATAPPPPAGAPPTASRPATPATLSAAASDPLIVGPPMQNPLLELSHPLIDPIEQTYSPHPVERNAQIEWDFQLIQRAIAQWQHKRAQGQGGLAGLNLVEQIPVGAHFLDGHVQVLRPSRPVELVVLGDLHGCYSCLKAALLQSNFIQRVWAHQWDPQTYPDVKLVLLGDYIDRGLFSFDGVLRAALHLFVSMPDHVIVLRGNHEYLRWMDNRITSGVHPAEALASIAPHVPVEMLDAYRFLFEQMPSSFICDRTMFVHAGIPRDDTFEARYQDLSSLNDPELRFQMMWSDPAPTQHIPLSIQQRNPRFSFGRNQFKAFMQRTGLHTMIRGHEKIEAGFQVVYDLGEHKLLSLFSSGGADNLDLPPDSSYRTVTPMALTIRYGHGAPTATPWPLQYQPFNYPPHNGLYRPHPLLEFRYLSAEGVTPLP